MEEIVFRTSVNPDVARLHALLSQDPEHVHIHAIDMPYRLSSTWQDHGCEVGLWEKGEKLVAWAVFQPPWWNVDYAVAPSFRGSSLETEIFAFGIAQMQKYAQLSGEEFYGSFELFSDIPHVEETTQQLERLGFTKFDWTTIRFTLDLNEQLTEPQLPQGFQIRPLRGHAEIDRYVALQQAAFQSRRMTASWRKRTLEHPAYRPELDLVVANSADVAVGFCVCWMWQDEAQIEPLGVLPEFQGAGLGRALELSAMQLLRDHGASTLHVDHTSFNEAAIALSEQSGFKRKNNALRYYVEVTPSTIT